MSQSERKDWPLITFGVILKMTGQRKNQKKKKKKKKQQQGKAKQ